MNTLDLASPGRAPLDPERRADVCAYIALLDAWLHTGPLAAARTLMTLVQARRATTAEGLRGLSVTMFGITGEPTRDGTLAALRAWQHAARDRLAAEARP